MKSRNNFSVVLFVSLKLFVPNKYFLPTTFSCLSLIQQWNHKLMCMTPPVAKEIPITATLCGTFSTLVSVQNQKQVNDAWKGAYCLQFLLKQWELRVLRLLGSSQKFRAKSISKSEHTGIWKWSVVSESSLISIKTGNLFWKTLKKLSIFPTVLYVNIVISPLQVNIWILLTVN